MNRHKKPCRLLIEAIFQLETMETKAKKLNMIVLQKKAAEAKRHLQRMEWGICFHHIKSSDIKRLQ
jgi:hypothetical protein